MENKILATVDGREIYLDALEYNMKTLPKEQVQQFQTFEGKKFLLNEMITQEMFYLDGKAKGFDTEEQYLKDLEIVKNDLLKQYTIRKLINGIKVEEDEVKAFYDNNQDKFKAPGSVKSSHILIKTEEEGNKILAELNEGKSFEEAAKEYSNCPSKERGGDLGFFERGKMVPEFEEAAFNLEIGKISGLVKTQFGYHIIKVEDKKEAELKAYDEVKKQIAGHLVKQKQDEKYFKYVEELKMKYEVTKNEELLK